MIRATAVRGRGWGHPERLDNARRRGAAPSEANAREAPPLLLIIGPSGSDKSCLAQELDRNGLVRLLPTWTTRPPRLGETAPGSCPEHRFVASEEFDRLARSGFFAVTGQLLGLPDRYGLAYPPAPLDGRVDAVIARASAVAPLSAALDRRVLVYQVEDELERIEQRLLDRALPPGETVLRSASADDELAAGRLVAHKRFCNSGSVEQIVRSVATALASDTAPLPKHHPTRPGSEWRPASSRRWHWVGVAVACGAAMAGLLILALFVIVIVGLSSYGSNK